MRDGHFQLPRRAWCINIPSLHRDGELVEEVNDVTGLCSDGSGQARAAMVHFHYYAMISGTSVHSHAPSLPT